MLTWKKLFLLDIPFLNPKLNNNGTATTTAFTTATTTAATTTSMAISDIMYN